MTPPPDTDPSDATIQRISSRIVYQNPWMQLREDVIQRPDGSRGVYSYVEKPDFALIIPVEQEGRAGPYTTVPLYDAEGSDGVGESFVSGPREGELIPNRGQFAVIVLVTRAQGVDHVGPGQVGQHDAVGDPDPILLRLLTEPTPATAA